jgi:nitrous oxide reductase accessory protein NosL
VSGFSFLVLYSAYKTPIKHFLVIFEMLSTCLCPAFNPSVPRNIVASYVHDMGKADWDHPGDYWIAARTAFYVYGGDKMGPMGEALVPFSTLKGAQIYVKDHGGKIFGFEDITMDMLRPTKQDHPLQRWGN